MLGFLCAGTPGRKPETETDGDRERRDPAGEPASREQGSRAWALELGWGTRPEATPLLSGARRTHACDAQGVERDAVKCRAGPPGAPAGARAGGLLQREAPRLSRRLSPTHFLYQWLVPLCPSTPGRGKQSTQWAVLWRGLASPRSSSVTWSGCFLDNPSSSRCARSLGAGNLSSCLTKAPRLSCGMFVLPDPGLCLPKRCLPPSSALALLGARGAPLAGARSPGIMGFLWKISRLLP